MQGKSKVENGVVTGVLGGCLPANGVCDSMMEDGKCDTANGITECQKCCKVGDSCNNWLDKPTPWSTAPINMASFLLICIMAVITYNF